MNGELAVPLRGRAILKPLQEGIMGQHSFIPVETNARSRSDLVELGFTRHPLRVDLEVGAER
jgi:hypothetical protein